MSRIPTIGLMLACAVGISVNTANAQFEDNFDQYANGTLLHNINGWHGWDADGGVAGTVTNAQSDSAPHSIAIGVFIDAVNELGNPTDGNWRMSVKMYIPSGSTGQQFFIMQNTYNDFGPYNWSVQTLFDSDTGMITDDFDTVWPGAPIPFDQWFEIEIRINLDADTCEQRIDLNGDGVLDDDGADNISLTADDELVSWGGYAWSTRAFDGNGDGVTSIGALDLYSNGGSVAYYDDILLEPLAPQGEIIEFDAYSIFRGQLVSGTLADVLTSNDVDLVHRNFITIFEAEAPITLDFFATAPNCCPSLLKATFESSANTTGLEITVLFFNVTTGQFDVAGTAGHTFNVDVVRTFEPPGPAENYVNDGAANQVVVRYEVRQVGIIFQFPWEDRMDRAYIETLP